MDEGGRKNYDGKRHRTKYPSHTPKRSARSRAVRRLQQHLSIARQKRKLGVEQMRNLPDDIDDIYYTIQHDHDYVSEWIWMNSFPGLQTILDYWKNLRCQKYILPQQAENASLTHEIIIKDDFTADSMDEEVEYVEYFLMEAAPKFEIEIEYVEQTIPEPKEEITLEGQRIVDIGHFLKEIANLAQHNPPSCSFGNIYPIRERTKGISSTITFQCRKCNARKNISLCDQNNTYLLNSGSMTQQ